MPHYISIINDGVVVGLDDPGKKSIMAEYLPTRIPANPETQRGPQGIYGGKQLRKCLNTIAT
jgi:hypothetical protein